MVLVINKLLLGYWWYNTSMANDFWSKFTSTKTYVIKNIHIKTSSILSLRIEETHVYFNENGIYYRSIYSVSKKRAPFYSLANLIEKNYYLKITV